MLVMMIILIIKAFMMMTMAMIFEVPLMLIRRVIGVRIIVMTMMLTCHLSLKIMIGIIIMTMMLTIMMIDSLQYQL